MVIPIWLYQGLLYGAVACVVLSLVYYAFVRKEPQPGDPPRAEVMRVPRWRRIVAWVPAVMFFGGAFGAWFVYRSDDTVICVRDDGGTLVARRMRVLGEPGHALVAGREPRGETWIVNESSRPVRIVTIHYDPPPTIGLGPPSRDAPDPPTVIPPGMAVRTYEILHVGPDQPPPDEIVVLGRVGGSREWLTWDRE